MKKNNEIEKLYSRFSREMDSIPLPSEEELMQIIDRYDAQDDRQAPFVPIGRRRTVWRYAVAAMLAAAMLVFGWLLWPQGGTPSPVVAESHGDTIVVEKEKTDSIVPTIIAVPDNIKPRQIASMRTGKPKLRQVGFDSAVLQEINDLDVLPAEQLPILAETEQADTAVAPQPVDADSASAVPMREHEIDDYPDRPTIRETEDIIKKEYNLRAIKKRKLSGRKKTRVKAGESFIDKQKDEKEEIQVVVPKSAPSSSAPMPHYISTGNVSSRIIWL